MVLHGKVERRGLADAPDLDRVLLREPVGRGHVRRVRHAVEERLPCRLGLTELVLEPLEVDLDLLQLLELLGRRLPLQLRPPAELVDLRYERPPALVGLEQLVEDPRRLVALADEGGAKRVRIGPGGLEVDHGRSLGSRRAASRRPRSRRTRRRRRSPARRASPRRTASRPGRSSRGRPRARSSAAPGRGSVRRCRSCRRPRACGTCRTPTRPRNTALPATGSPSAAGGPVSVVVVSVSVVSVVSVSVVSVSVVSVSVVSVSVGSVPVPTRVSESPPPRLRNRPRTRPRGRGARVRERPAASGPILPPSAAPAGGTRLRQSRGPSSTP